MNFTGYDNANLFFDDSSSLRRESLSKIYNEPYGEKSVYSSVFRPHPSGEGHHVHEPEHQRRPEAASAHAEDYLKSALRSGASELVNDTVEVTESITQHKYCLPTLAIPTTIVKVMSTLFES